VNVFSRAGELLGVMDPRLPAPSYDPASGEALPWAVSDARAGLDALPLGAGELVRVAAPVRSAGATVGVVIVSRYVPPETTSHARGADERYAKYRRAKAVKEPIKALYLSLFLFPALAMLFGAVWLSLYLAKRI